MYCAFVLLHAVHETYFQLSQNLPVRPGSLQWIKEAYGVYGLTP
jgi:hypothetical protein